MTRKRERLFAGFGALLFLATSSALTVAVVVLLIQQHHQNSTDTATNTANNTPASQTPVNPGQNTSSTTKLQGTKMQNFTPVATVNSLQVDDLVKGTGAEAKPGDTVTVDYTGAVAATGVIFQSSKDTGQTATFSLSQVIPGWSQGIPGMKVGGTRRLLIPAGLAYGVNPPSGSGIPANAALVFDVTLHSVQ